jgi:ribonuclease G
LAEWLLERGIGEDRAVRIERGEIAEARLDWPGALVAGEVADAVLIARAGGSSRGTARFASGEEALVGKLPKDASEGANLRLEVTRAAMGERGRLKRAQARPTTRKPERPDLADRLIAEGHIVREVRRFPEGDWDALLAEALGGEVAFAGGTLLFAPTPAMTVIDVDGALPPRALALGAVATLAAALRRFDLGGSIAVDFPTLQDRADRRAVDETLGAALSGWPHELTAMNGFGLVQIVARLERPSLLHRARHSRTALLARQLLRQAEAVSEPGALLLTLHPALEAKLKPEWLAELARRTGREVRLAVDPKLALEGAFAQAVPL